MKIAKNNNFKMLENFLFVSPAPADTAAKLSAVYRDMAETEKERANDLLEAADFCEVRFKNVFCWDQIDNDKFWLLLCLTTNSYLQ